MALNKQSIDMRFGQGLDTKSDPNQVSIGKFLSLQNAVFNKAGLLQKRNGFNQLTTLTNASTATTLTTFNNNLIATGSELYAYSSSTQAWKDRGLVQPTTLAVQSVVRNSNAQTGSDSAIAANGSICTVYVENAVSYYQVNDASTGQLIIPRVTISGTTFLPRVFVLGSYFIVTYLVGNNLNYIAIPTANPSAPLTAATLSTQANSTTRAYDGAIFDDGTIKNLYLVINGSDGGGAIRILYLSSMLVTSATVTYAGQSGSRLFSATDIVSSIVWFGWANPNANIIAVTPTLAAILAPTVIQTGGTYNNFTGTATGGVLYTFTEIAGTLAYSPNPTNNAIYFQGTTAGGTSSNTQIMAGVGLGSKAFLYNGAAYVWTAYGQTYQPTYFLLDNLGNVIMKMAYSNGGGYLGKLPSVTISGSNYYMSYLFKDLIAPVNKTQGGTVTGATVVSGIYSQTGVNIATFTINDSGQVSSEIANSLHLSGGELWQYDGTSPVEHGFHIWPEDLAFTTTTTGGLMKHQTYFYQVTYEWTDASGLLHRSAPSVPMVVDLSTSVTDTNTVTVYVPTLKLTSKTNVRILLYRWSTDQQVYYSVVPITSPLNNTTRLANQYLSYTDTFADASILGNTILYTTGGVIENIGAPANVSTTLFKNRLWLLTSEDRNLLWYSKPILENTPVEMSDLFTLYVAPTSGGSKSTGPSTAIASMDDKLIIFKQDAIYYETGTGPDITGNNNDFLDPVFITSTVGCTNLQSIVNMPFGLMFQSNKGIWLLARDLSTKYVGAPVEAYNAATVVSAALIPGTNQVRFSLSTGITLMYDYFYDQWGTFNGIPNISSTIWNEAHTLLDSYGRVLQEAPGSYLDASNPVLLSFQTGWINVAGLQGYERLYFFYLLGQYYTPFTLNVGLSYDYNIGESQTIQIRPDNYSPAWGGDAQWGSGEEWGGPGNAFEARIFPQQQKCESFQITLTEVYDSSLGVTAGQGLSLSGMNMIIGTKKGYRTQKASRSFG